MAQNGTREKGEGLGIVVSMHSRGSKLSVKKWKLETFLVTT